MAQNTDPHRFTHQNAAEASRPASGTVPTPAIISKKWLCGHFECQYPSGQMNYRRLYRLVLTDQVLSRIGMTSQEVRQASFREFDALTSYQLKIIFNLR